MIDFSDLVITYKGFFVSVSYCKRVIAIWRTTLHAEKDKISKTQGNIL